MNLLLTGASGFTGYYFKKQAEAAGYTVWPLAANLTDKAAVAVEVMRVQPTVVVHLAAISFVGYADEAAFYNINVLGTLNLLEALSALPVVPTKVLLASSANVYGNCSASPISETQVPMPVNHYASSKLAMEHMALTYSDRLPLVIARPFNYTGPRQAEHFLVPKLVSHFVRRAPMVEIGNLNVAREFNDVRTVCSAYLALLAYGKESTTYNVCSGNVFTLSQVIDALSNLTGHALDIRKNLALARSNEVLSLCGDPSKLANLKSDREYNIAKYDLQDTLSWMLLEATR